MNARIAVVLFSTAFAFYACYRSEPANPVPYSTASSTPSPSPSSSPSPSAAADLVGVWTNTCKPNGGTSSSRETYTFTSTTVTIFHDEFADVVCGTLATRYFLTGTYSGGDAATSPSGAKNYNYTFTQLTITPQNGDAALALNTQIACNRADWAAGTTIDVSATYALCNLGHVVVGSARYSIYKLDSGNLQWGAEGSTAADCCNTTATRPSTLESTTYTK